MAVECYIAIGHVHACSPIDKLISNSIITVIILLLINLSIGLRIPNLYTDHYYYK